MFIHIRDLKCSDDLAGSASRQGGVWVFDFVLSRNTPPLDTKGTAHTVRLSLIFLYFLASVLHNKVGFVFASQGFGHRADVLFLEVIAG